PPGALAQLPCLAVRSSRSRPSRRSHRLRHSDKTPSSNHDPRMNSAQRHGTLVACQQWQPAFDDRAGYFRPTTNRIDPYIGYEMHVDLPFCCGSYCVGNQSRYELARAVVSLALPYWNRSTWTTTG